MIINNDRNLPRTAKWGWRILLVLTAMLTLNGLILFFFIADSPLMQTASILEMGVGLLTLVVVWEGFRHGTRWAWNTIWVLVALLTAIGVHILIGGESGVGFWYLALATGTLVGQLLAGRGLV